MKNLIALVLALFVLPTFAQAPRVDVAVVTATAASVGSSATNVSRAGKYGAMFVVTNSAPAAGTFTCAASDICTKASHGYLTGLKVQVSTDSADLPLNLSITTDYFVIYLTANTFSLATTLLLAQAGTAIDIGDAGTGVHTITPTALAGASVKLQGSMDGTNYADLPIKATGDATKSASITASGNIYLSEGAVAVNYIRSYFTLTAGQLSVSQVSKVSP